jgi:hypothetical protein
MYRYIYTHTHTHTHTHIYMRLEGSQDSVAGPCLETHKSSPHGIAFGIHLDIFWNAGNPRARLLSTIPRKVKAQPLSIMFRGWVCKKTPLARLFPELPNNYLSRDQSQSINQWTRVVWNHTDFVPTRHMLWPCSVFWSQISTGSVHLKAKHVLLSNKASALFFIESTFYPN